MQIAAGRMAYIILYLLSVQVGVSLYKMGNGLAPKERTGREPLLGRPGGIICCADGALPWLLNKKARRLLQPSGNGT